MTIGAYFCWASDAGMPETNNAHRRDIGINTASGLTPAIQSIVVVVSPITLPAPPALAAATIAAR